MPFRTMFFFSAIWVLLTVIVGADIIGVPLKTDNEEPVSKPIDTMSDGIVGLIDPVMQLNRFTFEQTILKEHADEVPHWIVLFCTPWYEPCQGLEPVFKQLTDKWQNQLNNAVLSTEVRFAAVDCATEKTLCNMQNVDTYPFIAHYRDRKQVKVWRGKSFNTDGKRLRDFLTQELVTVAAAQSSSVDEDNAESGDSVPVDCLLIFAAIAGNAWFISRGGFGGEASSSDKKQNLHSTVPAPQPSDQRVSSSVLRSLPKEWGRDRPSYEL